MDVPPYGVEAGAQTSSLWANIGVGGLCSCAESGRSPSLACRLSTSFGLWLFLCPQTCSSALPISDWLSCLLLRHWAPQFPNDSGDLSSLLQLNAAAESLLPLKGTSSQVPEVVSGAIVCLQRECVYNLMTA